MMNQCDQCGRRLSSFEAAQAKCPSCGQKLPEQATAAWRAVARFANLAEVGFFADVLEGHAVATRVHHQQKFDAMGGHWQTSYELMVNESDVEQAVKVLREEIGTAPDEFDDEAPDRHDGAPLAPRSLASYWTPVIWAVLAGGLGYLAGRAESSDTSGRTAQTQRFLLSVADAAPFHSDPRPAKIARGLRWDHEQRLLVLEEDQNGDGRYDVIRAVTPVP